MRKEMQYKYIITGYEGGHCYPYYSSLHPAAMRKHVLKAKVYDRGEIRKVILLPGRVPIHSIIFQNGDRFDAFNRALQPNLYCPKDFKEMLRSIADRNRLRIDPIPDRLKEMHDGYRAAVYRSRAQSARMVGDSCKR